MGKKAYEKIAAGLDEVLAIARGEAKPAKLYIPAEINVKAVRAKLGLTQADFAALFGFSVTQIRDWEQGRARPLGSNRAYLMVIKADPQNVLAILRAVGRRKAA
jgi:putative transcriptional regulator